MRPMKSVPGGLPPAPALSLNRHPHEAIPRGVAGTARNIASSGHVAKVMDAPSVVRSAGYNNPTVIDSDLGVDLAMVSVAAELECFKTDSKHHATCWRSNTR